MGDVFEAIVTDAAPDASLPGYIKVKIPALFGDNEVPMLIPPITGPSAGGWQCIPTATVPQDDSSDDMRVTVIRVGPSSYRWIGSGQMWSKVATDVSGARSPNGRHWVTLEDSKGVVINVQDSGRYVLLGDDTASDFVALAQKVLDQLNSIYNQLAAHTHSTGVGPTSTPIGVTTAPTSVAATKVKAI